MNPGIGAQKERALVAAFRRLGTVKGTADATGHDQKTVRKTLMRLGLWGDDGRPVAAAPVEPVDPIAAEQERIARNRVLSQERELLKAVAGERSLRAFLADLFRDLAPQVPAAGLKYAPPRPGRDTAVETMLYLFSDWHGYEVVKPGRVLGLNQYDGQVMARRARKVVDAAVSIKERLERGGGWSFPDAVIALNGDFVSGTIHEVERHSDAPNVIMACYGVAMTLALAIRDLAARHRKVEVFCASGNHGRLPDARRMQQKDPTRNWDTVIYLYAMEALRGVANVTFYVPDSYLVAFDIGPWRFLQYHGHGIKSWNAIPHYGIDRFARNIDALMIGEQGLPIHYYLLSHFHSAAMTPASAGAKFVNGSLIGGNEFSVGELGAADPPLQLMLPVSPEHGVTAPWKLYGGRGLEGPSYPAYPWEAIRDGSQPGRRKRA